MQTGTRQPPIPPRIKFRGVSAVSVNFEVFRPVYFLGETELTATVQLPHISDQLAPSSSLRHPLLLLLSFPAPYSSYFSLSCREKHEEKWICLSCHHEGLDLLDPP